MSELLLDMDDRGIATVTLNRPEKRNAVTPDLLDALTEMGLRLRKTKRLRAVILKGAGGSFCAGMDISVLTGFATDLDAVKAEIAETGNPLGNRFQRPVTVWATVPAPVIAVCEGHVLGAGMQLALGADFRIATPEASLSVMEAKWGMIPDMGITQSLPRLLGADRAKLLMMTAKTLTGTEAMGLGLVTELAADAGVRAQELAETLLSFSPDALAASKRLVEDSWSKGALALEAELQGALLGAPAQMEKVLSVMQKREPHFG